MRSAPPSFLDTNILVYEWDDRDPKKQATARRLVRNVGKQGVISSQVLQEFASVMRSKLNATSRQIGPILGSYRAFGLVTIDFQLVEHGLTLAEEQTISFWDALIVEAAARSRCKTLYTEDLSNGQLIRGVQIVNPFLTE